MQIRSCNVKIDEVLTARQKKVNIYLATGYCSAECNKSRPDKATIVPVIFAIPNALQETVTAGAKTTNFRAEMARLLNIDDKNHSAHGSNFNQAQSKWKIITNLMAPLQGELLTTARATLEQSYAWYPGK